jgi:4-hydroxy-tetrahydrodipicolinate synthase
MKGSSKELTLEGTFPVLPTPFTTVGELDVNSFEQVIDYALSCGVDGIVFPGLASEYEQLTQAERLSMCAMVGARVNGQVPFVVGASAAIPELAIEYSVAGALAGASCAMVMAPNKFADDLEGMIAFFNTVADSVDIPIMLQNAPKPMGAGLPIEQVREILLAVPKIRYVKEETIPCGQRIEQLLADRPENLIGVFGGAGGRYIIDELNRGSLGTFPAIELTELHVQLVKAHRAGAVDLARELFASMLPILNMQAVYRCSLTKEVLRRRGIVATNSVRAPGPVMDDADYKELKEFWCLVEPRMGTLEVG